MEDRLPKTGPEPSPPIKSYHFSVKSIGSQTALQYDSHFTIMAMLRPYHHNRTLEHVTILRGERTTSLVRKTLMLINQTLEKPHSAPCA